jgi:hypothetical protein
MPLDRSDSVRTARSVRIETIEPQRPRPTRQLSRRDTAKESAQNLRVFQDRFESVPFADPKRVRAFGVGPNVHTEEHVLLIRRLRGEAARLSADLVDAKNKASVLQRDNLDLIAKNAGHRADITRMTARFGELSEALYEAKMQLDEADNVYAANKRHSRKISYLTTGLSIDKSASEPQSPVASSSRTQ